MRPLARATKHSMRLALLVLIACLSVGCTGGHPPPPNLPAPIQSTMVGPGDTLDIMVVGEKDLPHEYKVNPDGTIDFPYLDRVEVSGLEPQQITDTLKKKLATAKILTNAQVILAVKQYASKRVSLIGQVNKPGSVSWNDGLKLFEAIAQSGGFTSIADSNHVILTRQTGPGKSITVTISVDAIAEGSQPDVPLQAGDSIKVDARVF
jgi:polysaccharide biosynthesis/export protein VpsN